MNGCFVIDFISTLGSKSITYLSKKQAIGAMNSSKVEYIELSTTSKEVARLAKFTHDFGLQIVWLVLIYYNNENNIYMVVNSNNNPKIIYIITLL